MAFRQQLGWLREKGEVEGLEARTEGSLWASTAERQAATARMK